MRSSEDCEATPAQRRGLSPSSSSERKEIPDRTRRRAGRSMRPSSCFRRRLRQRGLGLFDRRRRRFRGDGVPRGREAFQRDRGRIAGHERRHAIPDERAELEGPAASAREDGDLVVDLVHHEVRVVRHGVGRSEGLDAVLDVGEVLGDPPVHQLEDLRGTLVVEGVHALHVSPGGEIHADLDVGVIVVVVVVSGFALKGFRRARREHVVQSAVFGRLPLPEVKGLGDRRRRGLLDAVVRPLDLPHLDVDFGQARGFQDAIRPRPGRDDGVVRLDGEAVLGGGGDAVFVDAQRGELGVRSDVARCLGDPGHGRAGLRRPDVPGVGFVDPAVGHPLAPLEGGVLLGDLVARLEEGVLEAEVLHGLLRSQDGSLDGLPRVLPVKEQAVLLQEGLAASLLHVLPPFQRGRLHLAEELVGVHLAVHAGIPVAAGRGRCQGRSALDEDGVDVLLGEGEGRAASGHPPSDDQRFGLLGVFLDPLGEGLPDGISLAGRDHVRGDALHAVRVLLGELDHVAGLLLAQAPDPPVHQGRFDGLVQIDVVPLDGVGQNGARAGDAFRNVEDPPLGEDRFRLGGGEGRVGGARAEPDALGEARGDVLGDGEGVRAWHQEVARRRGPVLDRDAPLDAGGALADVTGLHLLGAQPDQLPGDGRSDLPAPLNGEGQVGDLYAVALVRFDQPQDASDDGSRRGHVGIYGGIAAGQDVLLVRRLREVVHVPVAGVQVTPGIYGSREDFQGCRDILHQCFSFDLVERNVGVRYQFRSRESGSKHVVFSGHAFRQSNGIVDGVAVALVIQKSNPAVPRAFVVEITVGGDVQFHPLLSDGCLEDLGGSHRPDDVEEFVDCRGDVGKVIDRRFRGDRRQPVDRRADQ
mmetsp:Transcript_18777/g.43446  ORF Transcript_18777/g.43446 Transcript_18777/m.43446 type:complete len:865 (-) Transcript_18777:208-2802(-)